MFGIPFMALASSTTLKGASNMCRSGIWNEWRKAGIVSSVGSVGDSYDNALAETINGLYKAEVIHRRGPSETRSRRVRTTRMGRLVQPQALAGADRKHPSG